MDEKFNGQKFKIGVKESKADVTSRRNCFLAAEVEIPSPPTVAIASGYNFETVEHWRKKSTDDEWKKMVALSSDYVFSGLKSCLVAEIIGPLLYYPLKST